MFGITGEYRAEGGKVTEFEGPWADRRTIIAALPNNSIRIIRFYEHGAQG